jgi:hypothetical protein
MDNSRGLNSKIVQGSIAKWRESYLNSSIVSVPSLNLVLTYEVKATPNPPHSHYNGWNAATEVSVPMPAACM